MKKLRDLEKKTQGFSKKLKDLAKKTQGFAKKLNASESSDSVWLQKIAQKKPDVEPEDPVINVKTQDYLKLAY